MSVDFYVNTSVPYASLDVVETKETEPIAEPVAEKPKPLAVNDLYCSCVRYAHYLNPKIPPVSAQWFKNFAKATPAIGRVAIFSYGVGELKQHIAIVTAMDEKGFTVTEANYIRCQKGTRWVSWTDKSLVGFFAP